MIFSKPGRKHPAKKHPAATTPQSDSTYGLQHPTQSRWTTQSAVNLSRPPFNPSLPARHRPSGPESDCRRRNLPKTASTTDVSTHSPKLPPRSKPAKIEQGKALLQAPASSLHAKSRSIGRWQDESTGTLAQGALCALISSKFDAIITSIDGETFGGDAKDLVIHEGPQSGIRGGWGASNREASRGANKAISSAVVSTNHFAKANLYANSRLPPYLPPLRLHLASYPLLCLAAQYSQRAYNKPAGKEREAYVNANWHMGTKAMVIKSVPIDDINCVVFAIRGSQTFMDWAVNLNSEPVPPTDFLDDTGNLCHSGFLSVARKMIKPVAARLRSLLEEDPSRSTCSLLITGHSAGGAVASLLYAHMLAQSTRSELNILTNCFKCIHCLTFGTPPISLLPLNKPSTLRYKKSLFMSFINEGDPVPRADKAYIRSLLDLYTSPAPGTSCALMPILKPCKILQPKKFANAQAAQAHAAAPVWPVPPAALSNAGRLILLRQGEHGAEDVKAEITADQELRGAVFGDPVMHMMKIYARRVELLATRAVTAKIWE